VVIWFVGHQFYKLTLGYVRLTEVKESSVSLCAYNHSANPRFFCGLWGSSEPASRINTNQDGRKNFSDLVWISQTYEAAVRILSLSHFC